MFCNLNISSSSVFHLNIFVQICHHVEGHGKGGLWGGCLLVGAAHQVWQPRPPPDQWLWSQPCAISLSRRACLLPSHLACLLWRLLLDAQGHQDEADAETNVQSILQHKEKGGIRGDFEKKNCSEQDCQLWHDLGLVYYISIIMSPTQGLNEACNTPCSFVIHLVPL